MSRGPSLPVYVSRETLRILDAPESMTERQRDRIAAQVDAILAAANERGRRWRRMCGNMSERQLITRGLL